MNNIDKTILNLLTIIIGGVCLFSVLTRFNSPELSASFLGENPFVIKKNIIENTMFWIFASLALGSLLLQAYKEIIGEKIQTRLYTTKFYFGFFFISVVTMIFITITLTTIGNKVTRFKWEPVIVEKQKELFVMASNIIKNNGWRDDQLPMKDKLDDPEKYIKANWQTAESHIFQIEKLLEIQTDEPKTLQERIKKLKKHFDS